MPDLFKDSQAMLVRRWGELGGYWGINRTMAEIHALLFVTGEPLCTDDVMARLHVSRGNASMNLRGLVDWGLIQRVHHFGDRKEYFQADTNIWHMFETIMRERRRREVEPILQTIKRGREMVDSLPSGSTSATPAQIESYRKRLDELQEFLGTMGTLFELVVAFGSVGVKQLLGGKPESQDPPGSVATSELHTKAKKEAAGERKSAGGKRRTTRKAAR